MASIARTTAASIAQLTTSFRTGVTVSNVACSTALAHSRVGLSSRTFQASAAFASTSASASNPSTADVPNTEQPSNEVSSEVQPEKPKRRRRAKAEVEAARIAKQTFGIPMHSKRRTRTAIGGAIDASASSTTASAPSVTEPASPKRGRPRKGELSDTAQKRLAKKQALEAARAAAAAGNDEEVFTPEVMEFLLSDMTYDHLPPRDEWKTAFPNAKSQQTNYRYFVGNRSTIKEIIPKLGIYSKEYTGEKLTIIEGYPGPGTFASELLKLPKVEKLIALESTPCYLTKLEVLKQQLEEQKPGAGERLDIVEASAYLWDTYNQLVDSGKLGHLNNRVTTSDGSFVDFTTNDFVPPPHSDASWQKLSPIIFFAQLPNTVYGEQLFAQIITAIASRLWLFRHARIQLGFICGESLAKRCLAPAGDRISRGKLGTTVQCLADIKVHRYAHELQPHSHHFFPPTMSIGPRVTLSGISLIPNSNPSTGLTRSGMVMMTVTPKKDPLLKANEIEAFEFITRNLFILRTKKVGEALTHVAPGGQNILKMTSPEQVQKGLIKQEEVIKPEEIVGDLTNVQWACLARMFEKWPFRPQHLFEEGRIKPDRKGHN